MMTPIKQATLNLLADSLIKEILSSKGDFFSYKLVVCPNRNIQQWFKAYWLNNKSEIMMNIKFISIEDFLFSIFETDYSLATAVDIKNILIKLLSANEYEHTSAGIKDYLFDQINEKHVINQTKLYELSSTLSSLFVEYEKEDFISHLKFKGWEKEIYESLILELEKYKLTTLHHLFKTNSNINKNSNNVYLFGFLSIDKLYEDILDAYSKQHEVYLYQLELSTQKENKYAISSSPSIRKEIEIVHSTICELIDNGDKPTDFVVVGSGMNGYENVIKKVFNQDDSAFPNIPYSISGKKGEDSDLSLALKLLNEIVHKGFFTRLDFYTLINNDLIKQVRKIDDDMIEKWMDSIYTLNVYRNRITNDDWQYIRNRMLLAKLSDVNFEDNIVMMQGEETIPYSTIGLDDDSVISFVSFVDDLMSWMGFFKKASLTDKDTLLTFKEELKKWFANPVLTKIDKRYKKIDSLVDYWIEKEIVAPINTLLFLLLDASKLTTISFREPFTTGVAFVEFDERVTYFAKHVFFINCGANTLPSKKIKSELDLRDDFDLHEKEQLAFTYQYQNCGNIYFSFIDMDLKKDAELFESTFSKDIRMELITNNNPQNQGEADEKYKERLVKILNSEVKKHTIDETRGWDKLYSRGEYNKKDYREGLLSIKGAQTATIVPSLVDPDQEIQDIRKKASVSQLAKLLEEPLSCRASYLFGQEDDSNEKNHEEFELFTLNSLDDYFIVSSLSEMRARHAIKNPGEPFDASEFEKALKLENKLPNINNQLTKMALEKESKTADSVLNSIGIESNPAGYELLRLDDLLLDDNGQERILTCNKLFIRKESNNEIDYYELKSKNGKKPNCDCLYLYVVSLMDIASRNNEDEYSIRIHRAQELSFSINSGEATEILKLLFRCLNDYENPYFAFLDFDKKKVASFNKLMEYINEDRGPWGYFAFNKLFNVDTELGYDRNNYKQQDYYDNQNKMIKPFVYKWLDEVKPEPEDLSKDDD